MSDMSTTTIMTADAIANRVLVQEHLAHTHLHEQRLHNQDNATDIATRKARIKVLLQEQNAALVAHYYTAPELQSLAEETGGCVSDSLEMAKFGNRSDASTLVVAGVHFMGETAKILNPEKRILVPSLEATCSLDIGCPAKEFTTFCDAHPDHTVVVYANTSAAVKARSDWVVTSGIALQVVEHLATQGKPIIWAPDKHLGHYIAEQTGVEMLLWQGSCIVHDEFKAKGLKDMRHVYPEAAILVHPESPQSVIELADVVGSTTQLIKAAVSLPQQTLIIATDQGIFYKMQQAVPHKKLISAPTGGQGAMCRSCANCPWMAMNDLTRLEQVLLQGHNEVLIDKALQAKALIPLQRLMNFNP